MLDREPFLKAIFAAPADDLPRLVFADYLDEHGDPAWAELIRVQCEIARLPPDAEARRAELVAREWELRKQLPPGDDDPTCLGFELGERDRGFRPEPWVHVPAATLADADAFRLTALRDHPEWYGARSLKVTAGRITTPDPLVTILTSPVTENVTELDLSGRVFETPAVLTDGGDDVLPVFDIEVKPVIGVRAVEALARMRECRRLTGLDLRHNNLDNDAVRALANSPHLFRLRRLAFSEGNTFKGRVWQQLHARFGQDVVQ